jgi:hypothetical protein
MNFQGITIGIIAFAIIGVFHPIVIKTEYYIGKKAWPVFLVAGILLIGLSLFINSRMISAIIGVVGFSSLWSIHEIIEQEERVKKGWFPNNPNKSRNPKH